MRPRTLLLSTVLHGAALSCAIAWAGAGAVDARATPARLVLRPSTQLAFVEPAPATEAVDVFEATPPRELADLDEPAPEPFGEPEPADDEVLPWPTPWPRGAEVRIAPVPKPPNTEAPSPEQPTAPMYTAPVAHDATNAPPEYPAAAVRRGQTGTVHLRIHVGADGRVARVELRRSSGHTLLDAAALRAAWSWTFDPATRDGVAVAGHRDVPIEFVIRG